MVRVDDPGDPDPGAKDRSGCARDTLLQCITHTGRKIIADHGTGLVPVVNRGAGKIQERGFVVVGPDRYAGKAPVAGLEGQTDRFAATGRPCLARIALGDHPVGKHLAYDLGNCRFVEIELLGNGDATDSRVGPDRTENTPSVVQRILHQSPRCWLVCSINLHGMVDRVNQNVTGARMLSAHAARACRGRTRRQRCA